MEVVFEVYVEETNDFVMEAGLANVIYQEYDEKAKNDVPENMKLRTLILLCAKP